MYTCRTSNLRCPRADKDHVTVRYSFLHFLDTVFRYTHVVRTYGYILVCNFFATIRVFADIFIIWGFLLILKRNESLKPYEGSESLIILFSMFGVIQLCLQYALTFAWLSFVDLFIINRIAKISNIFEITFSAMYLVAALGMVIVILDVDEMIDLQSRRRRAESKTRESEDIKGVRPNKSEIIRLSSKYLTCIRSTWRLRELH